MPKKRASSATIIPKQWFVKELAGETAPSFSALDRLYELASTLFQLRPWQLLDESNLVLLRDSASGEICYCSVMGALGQVYAMHAYIGAESFRLFRKMEAGEVAGAGEFFATQRSVYVEFVPRKELEKQDRELLAVLGHPQGRGLAAPIFRAIRPGFHPWFVTHDEARTLAECMRAMVVACSAVAEQKGTEFWEQADTYPMVSRAEGDEPRYRIDLVKSILPAEPPLSPIQVEEETLRQIRSQDYAVRGVMELDHVLSGAAIGKKSERKACAAIALAVDAASGIVHAPEVTDTSVAAGDAVAKAFLNAIQANRTLPKEVRVRSRRLKDCLAPLVGSFGVTIKIAPRLPALEQARTQLLRVFDGGTDGR
jgi:hypothetical protein